MKSSKSAWSGPSGSVETGAWGTPPAGSRIPAGPAASSEGAAASTAAAIPERIRCFHMLAVPLVC